MQAIEQENFIEPMKDLTFGCCRWSFSKPIISEIIKQNIMLKVEQLSRLGTCGTPKQWLYVVGDMCDYLRMCDIGYKLKYVYPGYNPPLFNLKCLFLMLESRNALSYA